MARSFRAILKHDIQYTTLAGEQRIVHAGDEVEVCSLEDSKIHTDVKGQCGITKRGSFILIVPNGDGVDIEAVEFKTID